MMNKTRWFLVLTGVMAMAIPAVHADEFPTDAGTILLQTAQLAADMPTPASRPVNDQGALKMDVPTSDLIAFVQSLSKEEQDAVISKTASMMSGYFKKRDFIHTAEIQQLLSTLNADSGYALYFGGELHRKQGRRKESHSPFESYLAHEKTLPAEVSKTGPDIKECNKDSLGYCQQRTAWICHLLANDYFADSAKEMPEQKMALLNKAAKHAQCAIDNYPPNGFDVIGSLLQTVDLKKQIEEKRGH